MKKFEIIKTGITAVIVMMMFLIGKSPVFAQHQADTVGDTARINKEQLKHDTGIKYNNEVPVNEIDPLVSSTIEEAYADHQISKAYQAKDGSYKLKLEKGNEKITAYLSINGKLLRIKNGENEMDN